MTTEVQPMTERELAETALAAYRSEHRIDPEYPASSRFPENWCRVDGVRIHAVKGGFRHDMDEVRDLDRRAR